MASVNVLIDVSPQQFAKLLQFLHHCEDHKLSYDTPLHIVAIHIKALVVP